MYVSKKKLLLHRDHCLRIRPLTRAFHKIMATPTVYVPQCKAGWSPNDGQVCKRVGKAAEFGLIWGKGFGKRVAQSHPLFLGVSPGVCSDDYFVLFTPTGDFYLFSFDTVKIFKYNSQSNATSL